MIRVIVVSSINETPEKLINRKLGEMTGLSKVLLATTTSTIFGYDPKSRVSGENGTKVPLHHCLYTTTLVVEAGTNDLKAKFDLKIEDLELSVNAIHHLKQANLYYLGELVRESESMLIAKGLTRKNIREIQLLLQEDGMTLEMDTGGWGPII